MTQSVGQFGRLLALLFGMVILAACQSGTMPSGPVDTAGPAVERVVTAYQLDNGDSLRVNVFGEPELSGDYAVDGTGAISMPLIGTVEVAGMTVTEFQDTIEARLADGYLVEPRVSAEVTSFRPFYILGEVNRPDEYAYTSGLTVMNAVAAAGGFTYRANRKDVFIRSEGEPQERRVTLTTTTQVRPGDTIRIGERIF
ncbi:MAG: polysaccharide export protein [Hyphomonadaceae bacterium]|nr:polysaccharide export protein [Hyphomonadaceae bacterium]